MANLREKFKLLRQWQLQQEEFVKKKMDGKLLRGQKEVDSKSAEIEDMSEKNGENNVNGPDLSLVVNDAEFPRNKMAFLQRMSSNSLEHALKSAISELNNQNDDVIIESLNSYQDNEENATAAIYNDDGSESDATNYFQDNIGRVSLKTAIFRPKSETITNPHIKNLNSEGESEAEDANGLDGFYPITYSEDNVSQYESDSEDFENEYGELNPAYQDQVSGNVPFDEQPIKSKIGTDVISFEELIERQLKAEQEGQENRQQSKSISREAQVGRKKFLKKGEGTSRFKTENFISNKSKELTKKGISAQSVYLPKTSLKLKPEVIKVKEVSEQKTVFLPNEANGIKLGNNEVREGVQPVLHRNDIKGLSERNQPQVVRRNDAKAIESSMEASFQKMIQAKDDKEKISDEELAEFELLEQVALDTSISSNASSVLRIISRKQNTHAHSTPSPMQRGRKQEPIPAKKAIDLEEMTKSFAEISEEEANDVVETDSDASFEEEGNKTVVSKEDHTSSASENEAEMNGEDEIFLDDSTWMDTPQKSRKTDDENSTITESPRDIMGLKQNTQQNNDSSPPTSKLMKKFFPKLEKDEQSKPRQNSGHGMNERKGLMDTQNTQIRDGKENVPPQKQSELLKSKLAELDTEILRFKNENAELEKLRHEREKELRNLRNEVEQFQKQRTDELERIEKFRDEEVQKIKKEKKTFEKYQKAIRSAPSKKERDEIEGLRQQVAELQDDIKRREAKWNSSAARFRNRIEELENENFELKENLKAIEQERLQRWAKADYQHLTQKDKSFLMQNPEECLEDSTLHRSSMNPKEPTRNQQNKSDIKLGQPNVSRKVASIMKKTESPGIRIENRANRKAEGMPRENILPYQCPQAPSTKSVEGNIAKEIPPNRLSLTPERQSIHAEKSKEDSSEMRHQDGKVERVLSDGSREITFPNGTRKTIDPTNQNVVVSFFNGDIKQMLPDGSTIYYYAESKTTHTTHKDGTEVFEFSNGQSEKHYPDGRKVITFGDETVKCIFVNGAEETVFADGTIQNVDVNGDRTISFPNGQREFHSQNFKRREYPDGTVKTVYQDGRQETRYSSGRLRVKDQSGNIVLDTGLTS